MGLAEAERWTWALESRVIRPGPVTNFTVIILNYDPITHGDALCERDRYTYHIVDGQSISDALEFILDPLESGFNPIVKLNFAGEFLHRAHQ